MKHRARSFAAEGFSLAPTSPLGPSQAFEVGGPFRANPCAPKIRAGAPRSGSFPPRCGSIVSPHTHDAQLPKGVWSAALRPVISREQWFDSHLLQVRFADTRLAEHPIRTSG